MIPYFSIEQIFIFRTWGLFLALGILTPFIFVLKQAKKAGIKQNLIWDIFFWIVVGSLIGIRLGYVLQFPKDFNLNPQDILKFWEGGLTFYGGLLGGIGGAAIFAKRSKISKTEFFKIANLTALYFPLGIIIARTGCFLINDHRGAVTNLPWGILWPDGTTRHPVALYLILNSLIIFIVLNIVKDKFKKPGQLFFLFLFLCSLTRFFLILPGREERFYPILSFGV